MNEENENKNDCLKWNSVLVKNSNVTHAMKKIDTNKRWKKDSSESKRAHI